MPLAGPDAPTAPEAATVWRPAHPVDVRATLAPLRRGAGDPAHRVSSDGAFLRACRPPHGPATLRITSRRGELSAEAWGTGAEWVIASAPELVGRRDDTTAFAVSHPLVRDAHARHAGLRIPRTGLVLDALVPAA